MLKDLKLLDLDDSFARASRVTQTNTHTYTFSLKYFFLRKLLKSLETTWIYQISNDHIQLYQ